MFMLRGSASDPMLCVAQGLTTGVATSLSRGICNDTEASLKEGTQIDLRCPLLPRAHCAARSRRPIPQADKAGRLSSSVGRGRSGNLDRGENRQPLKHFLLRRARGLGSNPDPFCFPRNQVRARQLQYLIETSDTNGNVVNVIGHAARVNEAYKLF